MSFLYLFLSGILIGTGMVIPGVSGAVIAVILGVYDKAINSLNNLAKNFKKNIIFLIILGVGILVGAIWFSNILMFLYKKHEVITKFSFIGLILGGIPFLFKEIKKNHEKVNIKLLVITFLTSIILFILSNGIINLKIDPNGNFFTLFLAGLIYSIGKVIPGISGSFLLIIIGMYEFVLSIMSHPITFGLLNLSKVIPFIIGLILGIIVLLKIISYLLENHFGKTYSIIIGFVLGSVISLIPTYFSLNNILIGIIVMILSFILSYKLIK